MIIVKNLTKKYKKSGHMKKKYMNYALDNVSLNIKEGEITAILGINGAGKSTLLKSIAGIVKVDSGSICIDEERLNSNIYNKLIFIPDCDIHFAGFTINQMLDFYRDFYPYFNDKKADDMLEFFKLEKDVIIDSLSKGNIAKVKLVLAFSLDLKYILLDEPFNGIDIFKREEFVGMMAKYMDKNQSIILTTHEISDIEQIVDRVVILSEGKVVSNFEAEKMRDKEGKSILQKLREVSINE
ncbi:ABC transporter ATP-binding protein [Peptostreptococcus canis]|uniref:ABC transporter ATP-binding protein n=1 Tax=Peptostreptococcus canis TaxID=1159213 RepID=A0ABR6TPB5_9FIRM|nr:ABC transporter ATP-binding protein [Peptostreptococcus canis]MBC2576821.1 ABC transporter ATP-binding protein [Peptostreptococcus canis]MBP1998891.1 ABC-2 type transport system ATP-binding protein [Peptostreptococcus canis]